MMESKDNGPSKKDGEKAIKRYQIANYAKSVKDYLQAYNVYLKRVCSNMENILAIMDQWKWKPLKR